MLLKDRPRGFYGLDQYQPPLCYELEGKLFTFMMDDGHDQTLEILDKQTLRWSLDNGERHTEEYRCVKADNTTYLLTYELAGAEKRTNHTFIIDLENMLVTRVIAKNGENPKNPYLNNTYFEFGAIVKEDGTTEFRRHSYTDEMIGTCMQWNYGSCITVHVYYCSDFYRITYPRDGSQDESINAALDGLVSQLPSADEPADYIKIKENMYLVSITEKNMERLLGAEGQFRSNNLCFLQNYDRMYQVGRAFGNVTIDGVDTPIRLLFGAAGKFCESPDDYMTAPNPFVV